MLRRPIPLAALGPWFNQGGGVARWKYRVRQMCCRTALTVATVLACLIPIAARCQQMATYYFQAEQAYRQAAQKAQQIDEPLRAECYIKWANYYHALGMSMNSGFSGPQPVQPPGDPGCPEGNTQSDTNNARPNGAGPDQFVPTAGSAPLNSADATAPSPDSESNLAYQVSPPRRVENTSSNPAVNELEQQRVQNYQAYEQDASAAEQSYNDSVQNARDLYNTQMQTAQSINSSLGSVGGVLGAVVSAVGTPAMESTAQKDYQTSIDTAKQTLNDSIRIDFNYYETREKDLVSKIRATTSQANIRTESASSGSISSGARASLAVAWQPVRPRRQTQEEFFCAAAVKSNDYGTMMDACAVAAQVWEALREHDDANSDSYYHASYNVAYYESIAALGYYEFGDSKAASAKRRDCVKLLEEVVRGSGNSALVQSANSALAEGCTTP